MERNFSILVRLMQISIKDKILALVISFFSILVSKVFNEWVPLIMVGLIVTLYLIIFSTITPRDNALRVEMKQIEEAMRGETKAKFDQVMAEMKVSRKEAKDWIKIQSKFNQDIMAEIATARKNSDNYMKEIKTEIMSEMEHMNLKTIEMIKANNKKVNTEIRELNNRMIALEMHLNCIEKYLLPKENLKTP